MKKKLKWKIAAAYKKPMEIPTIATITLYSAISDVNSKLVQPNKIIDKTFFLSGTTTVKTLFPTKLG